MPPRVLDSPEEAAQVQALKRTGLSGRQIAQKLGVSETAVRNALRRVANSPSRASPSPRPASLPTPSALLDRVDEIDPLDPAVAAVDDVATLKRLLVLVEKEAAKAAAEGRSAHLMAASRTTSELVRRLRQFAPPKVPTLDDLEEMSRPKAAAVVAKIRKGILRLKRADLETNGKCSRCGAALSEETKTVWRAEVQAALDRGED